MQGGKNRGDDQGPPPISNVVRAGISPAGMRIMRLLIGRPPLTIDEMVQKLGVTRTAVKEQLDELSSIGYVEQEQERCASRGRPRYLFAATDRAMRQLFDGNQDIVVPAIWKAIRRHAGDDFVEMICHEVAKVLAARYGQFITGKTPRSRIKEIVALLERTGRLIEYIEVDERVEVRKYNCPFASMSDGTGLLCYIDCLAMQLVAGEGVHLLRNRHEGKYCCVFLLDANLPIDPTYADLGAGI